MLMDVWAVSVKCLTFESIPELGVDELMSSFCEALFAIKDQRMIEMPAFICSRSLCTSGARAGSNGRLVCSLSADPCGDNARKVRCERPTKPIPMSPQDQRGTLV